MPTKKTNTPKPEVAETVPPAGQIKPKRLSPVMAEIADQVAELLIHGESRELVEMIVKAAAMNKWHSFYSPLEDDPAKVDAAVTKFATTETAKWMEDLVVSWRENRRAEPEDQPEPVTVTDRIREAIIESLRIEFEDFLRNSHAEERSLMRDIFIDYGSSSAGNPNELVLAYAFEYQVKGRADAFIRCPEKLQRQVQTYIQCLVAALPCTKLKAENVA